MIHIECEQGTAEWLRARAGVPSASNFDRVLTPKTMKPSASMLGYCYELLAEQVIGRPLDDATTSFMQRGNILEKDARKWYEFERDVTVETVGFLLRDDARCGCSPDGLVGTDGGLEIKCPSAAVHMGYLLGETGEKYRCQIQGAMWITRRAWWDFVSYNPELPPVLVRFERDDAFISKLAESMGMLLALLDTHRATMRSMGYLPELADAA